MENTITASPVRVFMSRVYAFMGLGLLITALTAFVFYQNEAVASLIYNINPDDGERSFNWLGYVFLFAPLVLIFVKMAWVQNKSYAWVMGLYGVITALMGATLSSVFMVYDLGVIYLSFGAATGTFLGMSVIGATTKTDLTKLGGFLIMALWGLILASILNIFFASGWLEWVISYVGILIFVGLTAYDTQKLIRMARDVEASGDQDMILKQAILGGFELYLDFVNLLLLFLRIFGMGGRD